MLFNRFPVYFILTNVIIVPLASLLIITGFLVFLTFSIIPVSGFLAHILDKLTGLTEFLTATAASLPYSTIDKIGMTAFECGSLVFAIFLLMFFLLKKQPFSIKYPVIAFILFVLAVLFKRTENSKTNELIVYNNPSFPTTGIRTGNTLNLLTMNDSVPSEVIRHIATEGLKIRLIHYEGKPKSFKVGAKDILLTDSLKSEILKNNNYAIVVMTGKRPYIEKNIPAKFLAETIVFSAETPPGFKVPISTKQIIDEKIIYVRKSGAYICRL